MTDSQDRPCHHLIFGEPEFRRLVAGEIVELRTANSGECVRIILSDIGFDRLLRALCDATIDSKLKL